MPQHVFDKLETYKDIFDNAHDLIHALEPDGKIIYVNKAWEKTLGYKESEIKGSSFHSLVQPEDRDRYVEYRKGLLAGYIQGQEISIGLVTKGGNIIIAEGIVSVKVLDGQPVYTRGIFRDVTRRVHNEAQLKLLHEQLKEREANLRQLFFYAPDAIIVINAQSNILYWNPKAEQIFGWTQEEVLGKDLSGIIIPPQHRDAHIAGMQRYLMTGETRVLNTTIEITSLHKTGREFYVALTISSTNQKEEPAFIAFIRDIHDQKRNEQELAQKKVQLELSNQQLEQFAHVASHDMKEPIRKILLFTDRLQSEIEAVASEKAKWAFEKIQGAALRLSDMVDGVLRNSSIRADGLISEDVNLNEIIKNIETDLEFIIGERKAVIRYSHLPTITGSEFLLYQLFYNLINNALKFFRPDVSPVIEITVVRAIADEPKSVDPHVTYYKITVADNGIGFRQEFAESIFKTFTRLNSKEKYEGTGIGLSVCKTIVEKHGGFIQAFGKEGEGARFVIFLPVR